MDIGVPLLRALRWRSAAAALLAMAVLAAACGDDDDTAAPAPTEPAATAVVEPTVEAEPTDDAAAEPTADEAGVEDPGAGSFEETFVDPDRATPPSGDDPGTDNRTLPTLFAYPADADPAAGLVDGATPAATDTPYPLLMFAHGLGGSPEGYDDVIAALAAGGHVVVAPAFPRTGSDNPGGPDAGDTGAQPGDISFLIDKVTELAADPSWPLAGVVDTERIAVMGHSNGAITTLGISANSCCRDERVDVAAVLAGTPAPFDGEYDFDATPPMLLIHGTDDDLIAYEGAVSVFNEVTAPKGLLTLNGADHGSWLGRDSELFDDVVTTTLDFFATTLDGDAEAADRLEQPRAAETAELVVGLEPDSRVTVETDVVELDREASAEPTADLVDGQVVTVTWSGFLPGRVVNVVQCSQGATSGNAVCDLTKGQILQPNPTGEGSLELEIIVGAVGTGFCDATIDDCVIVVNDAGLPDPDATIRIPITFAD